jgi:hydroxyquinol 1,2-dioxygenase
MAIDFSEDNITQIAIERLEGVDDARFKEIMSKLIQHLHDFVRDAEITMAEWKVAIDFLTATGQKCDDKRQEFILLSDTLGVSMLVDAITNRKEPGSTESSVLGPFYRENAPFFEHGSDISGPVEGEAALIRGHVLSQDGAPIEGAVLDVWQAAPSGLYEEQDPDQPDMNLRGRFRSAADGSFWFKTVKPAGYPIPVDGPVGDMLRKMGRHNMRPAHLHFIVSADGHAPVTTELYTRGDAYLETDTVFGVKDSLVVDYVPLPAREKDQAGMPDGRWLLDHDFKLDKAA